MNGFFGYERADGRIGIRNHVIILPTVICANSVAIGIEKIVPQAIAIPHVNGCTLDPASNAEVERVLAGIGSNPNVAGVLLVSLGCESVRAEWIKEKIASSGRPVESIVIQQVGGTVKAVEKGVEVVRGLLEKAGTAKRQEFPVRELVVGTECGASDGYSGLTANPALGKACNRLVDEGAIVILSEVTEFIGAEEILARQCLDGAVRARLLEVVRAAEENLAAIGGSNVADITPGNIAGGLTTIEEKSLGCIKKGGTRPIVEVVGYGEIPSRRGLVIMDTPGHDIESITGMTAGGAQLVVFTTGRGTPAGSPIVPVIKVASNSDTYQRMKDNMDVDAGTILTGKKFLEDVGEEIYDKILVAAKGERTKSEILGNREFALRRAGMWCVVY